jgi:hypothetical protein
MQINTENIFKENELDKGFVLRANDTVAKIIRELINNSTAEQRA